MTILQDNDVFNLTFLCGVVQGCLYHLPLVEVRLVLQGDLFWPSLRVDELDWARNSQLLRLEQLLVWKEPGVIRHDCLWPQILWQRRCSSDSCDSTKRMSADNELFHINFDVWREWTKDIHVELGGHLRKFFDKSSDLRNSNAELFLSQFLIIELLRALRAFNKHGLTIF